MQYLINMLTQLKCESDVTEDLTNTYVELARSRFILNQTICIMLQFHNEILT